MDAYLNIVSLRAIREYSAQKIPDGQIDRILEAGRATGSSRNTQPWTLHVVRTRAMLDRLAETVYAPENLQRCVLAVAIVSSKAGFDTGRCGQNMMLAAWADGIVSSPNGVRDGEVLRELLRLPEDESAGVLISFGYPKKPRTPHDAGKILKRIDRKSLDEIVVRID